MSLKLRGFYLLSLPKVLSIMPLTKRKRSEAEDGSQSLIEEMSSRIAEVERKALQLTNEVVEIKRLLVNIKSSSVRNLHQNITGITETDSILNIKDVNQYNFIKDDGYVVVFTDGACENNGKPNAKAGIGVYFAPGCPLNVSQPVSGRPTNNTAEIQACVAALKIADQLGIKKMKIKTDSKFVINSITQWIHKWKKNNWKLSTGGDVKNKEDFVVLDSIRNRLDDVQWEYVEGHKGHVGNEEADKLARQGALLFKH